MILTTVVAALLGAAASASHTPDIPANLKPEYLERVDSADYYVRAEMWSDAERCLKDALRVDPANFNNSLVLCNLGMVHSFMGQDDEALTDFTHGLGFSPRNTTLLSNRARLYLQGGKTAEAMDDLNAILAIDPEHAWARKMRGFIYYSRAQEEEALRDLEALDSDEPDVIRIMAFCQANLNHTEQALELFDRLITASPTEESYADRALFLLRNGKINEAMDDVREGLKINERHGNLYLIRAKINRELHQNRYVEIDKKMARDYGADNQLFHQLFPEEGTKK